MSSEQKNFCIGIIGTGPIGLECGLRALRHGYRFILFESGDDIASSVRSWSYVHLFTPLEMNMSALGRTSLTEEQDGHAFLSGGEYIDRYLRPISRLFQSNIRLRHRVISVGRDQQLNQFVILVENGHEGREEYITVDCVIDASGTYACPNFIGSGGLPAIGERAYRTMHSSPILSLIPSEQDERFAGKRIVLIGKGHSAATSAVNLARLKEKHPTTQLFWILKQSIDGLPFCSDPDDPLKQRRELANKANAIYADRTIFTQIYTNTVITKLTPSQTTGRIDIPIGTSTPEVIPDIDYIIANTGSHPDRSLYENLSVHECYRTKGPMALAIQLSSSSADQTDCLKQTSHGASSMLTTEKNFFIVGNKSYGKKTNFLMQIGFEQVGEIFQLIESNLQRSKST